MNRTLLYACLTAAAVAATGLGVAAIAAASSPGHVTTTSQHADLHPTEVRSIALHAMPVGQAEFGHDRHGHLRVTLTVTGLTPGSAHTVRVVRSDGANLVDTFDTLAADGTGQATATLTSSYYGGLPSGARLQLLEGIAGPFGQHNALAGTPIADTAALPHNPAGVRVALHAVDVTVNGVNEGPLAGAARISVDATAHTVTVTVDATGFTPGNHADHLHLGSCASQGAPQVMLPDLNANAAGRIHQTVTTTVAPGTLTSLPATGMYFNIHQGDMNSILVDNAPALSFRPLLCGNV